MNSKQKGKRGELEVAHILKENGFENARRTAQYCGNTGDASDVVGLDGFHIEIKRCETIKIMDWIRQAERDHKAEEIPLVVFRKSHDDWYAVLKFTSLLELIKTEKSDRFSGGDNEQN